MRAVNTATEEVADYSAGCEAMVASEATDGVAEESKVVQCKYVVVIISLGAVD